MTSDEKQIRALVQAWHDATRAGDIETVLGLMTDDVVFLVPGRSPMRKAEFAALSRTPAGSARPIIESAAEVREVQVSGDLAFMWAQLSVRVAPHGSAPPMQRAGHTLTVFRRVGKRWLLARDANLLTIVPQATP